MTTKAIDVLCRLLPNRSKQKLCYHSFDSAYNVSHGCFSTALLLKKVRFGFGSVYDITEFNSSVPIHAAVAVNTWELLGYRVPLYRRGGLEPVRELIKSAEIDVMQILLNGAPDFGWKYRLHRICKPAMIVTIQKGPFRHYEDKKCNWWIIRFTSKLISVVHKGSKNTWVFLAG